jgi:hypothetical protein
VFGATSRRRVFALHRVSCACNHIRHWEAEGLPIPSNLNGGVAQGPDAIVDPDEVLSIPQEEAAQRACAAFQTVFENGPKIELDHYVVYFARESTISSLSCGRPSCCLTLLIVDFEYGRLLACMGDNEGARTQLDLVMSGKPLEVNSAGRKVRGASKC